MAKTIDLERMSDSQDMSLSPTLDDLRAQFLATISNPRTASAYRWALTALEACLVQTHYADYAGEGPLPIAAFHDDIFVVYHHYLVELGRSRQTVITYLAALRRFFVWLE